MTKPTGNYKLIYILNIWYIWINMGITLDIKEKQVMNIIDAEVISTVFVGATSALVLIWVVTMISVFRNTETGFPNKRERISRHNRDRFLPSHKPSECDMCVEPKEEESTIMKNVDVIISKSRGYFVTGK